MENKHTDLSSADQNMNPSDT